MKTDKATENNDDKSNEKGKKMKIPGLGFLSSFLNFRFFNLLILSLSFMIVFSGYNTAQNFATSVHDDVGSISLAIIYIFFAFSSLNSVSFFSKILIMIFYLTQKKIRSTGTNNRSNSWQQDLSCTRFNSLHSICHSLCNPHTKTKKRVFRGYFE